MTEVVRKIKLVGPSNTGKTTLWEFLKKGLRARAIPSTQNYVPGSFTLPLYQEDLERIAEKKVEKGLITSSAEWVSSYLSGAQGDYENLVDICDRLNSNGILDEDKIMPQKTPYILVRLGSADVGGQDIFDGVLEEECENWVDEQPEPVILLCYRGDMAADDEKYSKEEVGNFRADLLNKIGILSGVYSDCGVKLYEKPVALVETWADKTKHIADTGHAEFQDAIYPTNGNKVPYAKVSAEEMNRHEFMYEILSVVMK